MTLPAVVRLICSSAAVLLALGEAVFADSAIPHLRVVTYNIFWGRYGMEGLVSTLRRLEPDVVLLQEVDRKTERSGRRDQFEEIRKALKMDGVFGDAFHYPDGIGLHGLAILSKLPLLDTDLRRLDPVPGHKDRAVLRARIEWQGHTLSFYTTHLVAWGHGRGTASADRNAQAKALRAFTAEDPIPFVLGGDMNTTPHSEAYRILTHGLLDAWKVAGRGGWGATSYSFLPTVRIDHIYVSPGLKVIECRVGSGRASDHFPVIADIVIDPPSQGEPEAVVP